MSDPASTSATSDVGESGDCDPEIVVGALAQVSELSFGLLEPFDMDLDGALDLVGGRGIIAHAVGEEFDISVIADAPNTNNGAPGNFGGTDVPDVLFVTATPDGTAGELRTYLDGSLANPVTTPATVAWSFDVRDTDQDGLDDLALLIEGAAEVQLWHATPAGGFVPGLAFDHPGMSTLAFVAVEPPRIDVAIADPAGVFLVADDGQGGAAETLLVQAPYTYFLSSAPSEAEGPEQLLEGAYWNDGFFETAPVGFIYEATDGWTVAYQDTDAPAVTIPTSGDISGDGLRDVAIFVGDESSSVLDFLCRTPDAGLVACGQWMPASGTPESVAFLLDEGAPRLVYSTTDSGTWVADLTVVACP